MLPNGHKPVNWHFATTTTRAADYGQGEDEMDAKLFKSDPRDFALALVDDGLVDARHLLLCALKYMSHDDCREMLDCNELSPRFDEDEGEDEEVFELTDKDEVRDAFWEDSPQFEDDRDDDKSQNDYSADIRTAFVDWLDQAHRDGRLSDDLAGEATL